MTFFTTITETEPILQVKPAQEASCNTTLLNCHCQIWVPSQNLNPYMSIRSLTQFPKYGDFDLKWPGVYHRTDIRPLRRGDPQGQLIRGVGEVNGDRLTSLAQWQSVARSVNPPWVSSWSWRGCCLSWAAITECLLPWLSLPRPGATHLHTAQLLRGRDWKAGCVSTCVSEREREGEERTTEE